MLEKLERKITQVFYDVIFIIMMLISQIYPSNTSSTYNIHWFTIIDI